MLYCIVCQQTNCCFAMFLVSGRICLLFNVMVKICINSFLISISVYNIYNSVASLLTTAFCQGNHDIKNCHPKGGCFPEG